MIVRAIVAAMLWTAGGHVSATTSPIQSSSLLGASGYCGDGVTVCMTTYGTPTETDRAKASEWLCRYSPAYRRNHDCGSIKYTPGTGNYAD